MKFQFIRDLKNQINQKAHQDNLLLICLEKIGQAIKLPVQWELMTEAHLLGVEDLSAHEAFLRFMMLPVSLSHQDQMHFLYPVLVEYEAPKQFRVLVKNALGRTRLYNPVLDQYERLPSDFYKNKALRAWQCCPTHFPLHSKFIGLFQAFFSCFKKEFVQTLGIGIVTSSAALLIAAVSGYIFSHFHLLSSLSHSIILVSFFLFILGSVVLSGVNALYIKTLNTKLLFSLLPSVWYQLLNIPLRISKSMVSGEMVQRITDYEISIAALVTCGLTILFDGMICCFLLAYMAWCHVFLAGAYLIICLTGLGLKLSILPQSIQHMTSQLIQKGKVSALLNEVLLQIHKCRSSGREGAIHQKWLEALLVQKGHEESSTKIDIFSRGFDIVLLFMLSLCLYSMVYWQLETNPIKLLPFIVCAGQFAVAFEKLSGSILSIAHLLPGLKRVEDLLNEPVEIYAPGNIQFEPKGNLSLIDVSWQHKETGKQILDHVSLEIKAGEFVGLVGPSGAGKTSIFKLLLGFEALTSGCVLVDGINLKHLNMQALRRKFGIVLQTTNLFPGSIFSNITVNANISLDEVWNLVRCVGLEEEIKAMPMQLQTYLSDNPGESISGGQKQKILIARALASNPKILLLDEATSAMDNQSQQRIHQNLKALNITRLVIAHRYSTLQGADKIYVIEGGRVINQEVYNLSG